MLTCQEKIPIFPTPTPTPISTTLLKTPQKNSMCVMSQPLVNVLQLPSFEEYIFKALQEHISKEQNTNINLI